MEQKTYKQPEILVCINDTNTEKHMKPIQFLTDKRLLLLFSTSILLACPHKLQTRSLKGPTFRTAEAGLLTWHMTF